MSIELDATLALTAKLQAAEARALAAEASLVQIDDAIHLSLQAKDSWTGLKAVTCAISQMRQLDLTAARELMRKAGEADTLRTERDELAALVGRIETAAKRPWNYVKVYTSGGDVNGREEGVVLASLLLTIIKLGAPAALAALRKRVRVEVLEEVATLANEKAVSLMRDSAKAHEDNCPIMGRARLAEARLFDFFAHKIRAMKEAQ